jgi:hypothetical protein
MFNRVSEVKDDVMDLKEIVIVQGNIISCMDKKLNYAIERVAILESYRKELGEFLDKFLKASGYEYKFSPTQLAKYDIIKTKK